MTILEEVLTANEAYAASFGTRSELTLPPARGFAILTCMDARLDPAKYAGLHEGDAHVIRNAGGRASDDAIRSLVISYKLLGTKEWFVIHHTNCGMEFFTDQVIRDLLANSLDTAALTRTASTTSAPAQDRPRRTTSTGSQSATTPAASSRMSHASAHTHSFRPASRSTATSMTSPPAAS
jgi:carbonic anhydrase